MRSFLASLAGLALLASPMIASAAPAQVAKPAIVKAASARKHHHHAKSANHRAKKGAGRHAMKAHRHLRVARVIPHK